MNKKKVPEEIAAQIEKEADDRFPTETNIGISFRETIRKNFINAALYGYSLASLPAEPSTPETKDKPATGSGGGAEDILKKHIEPGYGLSHNLKKTILAAMEEYATLRQPTGAIAYVKTGKEATDYILQEFEGDKLVGEYFVKPIQFLPEREGVNGNILEQAIKKTKPADYDTNGDPIYNWGEVMKNYNSTKPSSNPPEKE